jgi:hypothetical protein
MPVYRLSSAPGLACCIASWRSSQAQAPILPVKEHNPDIAPGRSAVRIPQRINCERSIFWPSKLLHFLDQPVDIPGCGSLRGIQFAVVILNFLQRQDIRGLRSTKTICSASASSLSGETIGSKLATL